MIGSIELQVISRILTTESEVELSTLCSYDSSYYSVFKQHIEYILDHIDKYGNVPDVFTFQAEFPDVSLLKVSESLRFLNEGIRENKQHILLLDTFNKMKDLGSDDISQAWAYLRSQCDKADQLNPIQPMNIVKDAPVRAQQVKDFSKQTRIPTGFDEIDKLMYGGLSTVEELVLIVARTNTGKSWVCTRMMETAQKNEFIAAYYSPEMQASFLGTRFDTWRGHFKNSQLYTGNYSEEYTTYIDKLSVEKTGAYVIEDKDMPDGRVTARSLETFVKQHGVQLLIVDGLSYMYDDQGATRDVEKYKNICLSLFKMSKRYGCAVVVVAQANRDTKEMKDDKGEPFPNLYAVEGSDHPGRICTQAFAIRQIFDKHVLDIRLEKSRMANNQRPILSYAWDVNNGNCQYMPGGGTDDAISKSIAPVTVPNFGQNTPSMAVAKIPDVADDIDDEDFEDDVEF